MVHIVGHTGHPVWMKRGSSCSGCTRCICTISTLKDLLEPCPTHMWLSDGSRSKFAQWILRDWSRAWTARHMLLRRRRSQTSWTDWPCLHTSVLCVKKCLEKRTPWTHMWALFILRPTLPIPGLAQNVQKSWAPLSPWSGISQLSIGHANHARLSSSPVLSCSCTSLSIQLASCVAQIGALWANWRNTWRVTSCLRLAKLPAEQSFIMLAACHIQLCISSQHAILWRDHSYQTIFDEIHHGSKELNFILLLRRGETKISLEKFGERG